MLKLSNHKKMLQSLVIILVFALLLINITYNIRVMYTVSTMKQRVCIPIMMYHQVKNSGFGKDVISPYEFESDLKYLVEKNYNTITMTELIDYVYEGKELPLNPIILTFDDGYLSTYKNVYPLLKKYNMKIVLSIVGKTTDDFSRVVDNNISHAHATWNQVNEMKESGLVEIQNHSYNLHKVCKGRYGCGQMYNESLEHYEQILTDDLQPFQEKIASVTNVAPNTFTYPYGKYNDNTDMVLKKLNFKASLSVDYGVNVIKRDRPEKLFGLKRICRSHNINLSKLIKEGMATLKYVGDN